MKKARILEEKSNSIEADDGNQILNKVFNPSLELKNNRWYSRYTSKTVFDEKVIGLSRTFLKKTVFKKRNDKW